MIGVDQQTFEDDIDNLLDMFGPIDESNDRRGEVVSFVRDVVTRRLDKTFLVECGSSALKSYMPESDLDMVLLAPHIYNNRDEMGLLTNIFNALCAEVSDKEDGQSAHPEMTIRNVEFVNARTKLAHCLVNNIAVDITVNQVGALTALTFLEEVDRFIGCDHLFKRSVLLVKSWCQYESAKYCGVPVLGAKVGMLSSYAVSVMVLHIFNKFTANMTHPFSVLRSFFYSYMAFPWDTHVLTLEGPQPIAFGGLGGGGAARGGGGGQFFCCMNTNMAGHGHNHGQGHGGDGSVPRRVHGGLGGHGSFDGSGSAFDSHGGGFDLSDPKYMVYGNRFHALLERYKEHPAQRASNAAKLQQQQQQQYRGGGGVGRFPVRCCNIQDPIDSSNNLGMSVSRANLQLLEQALRCGFQHLENTLALHAASAASAAASAQATACPSPCAAELSPERATKGPGSLEGSGMGMDRAPAGAAAAGGGARALSGAEVRTLLEPVAPQNLGYEGTPADSGIIQQQMLAHIAAADNHVNNSHHENNNNHRNGTTTNYNNHHINTNYSSVCPGDCQYSSLRARSDSSVGTIEAEVAIEVRVEVGVSRTEVPGNWGPEYAGDPECFPGTEEDAGGAGNFEAIDNIHTIGSIGIASMEHSPSGGAATTAATTAATSASTHTQAAQSTFSANNSPDRAQQQLQQHLQPPQLGSPQQQQPGMFLQEFFPIVLNLYGPSYAYSTGAGGDGDGSGHSHRQAFKLRHDLMEHPLQALAASRGQGAYLQTRGGGGGGGGSRRRGSFRSQQSAAGAGTTMGGSDATSVCSDGTGYSAQTTQTARTGSTSFEDALLGGGAGPGGCPDALQGDLPMLLRALQLATVIRTSRPRSPPASSGSSRSRSSSGSGSSSFHAVIADIGHYFSNFEAPTKAAAATEHVPQPKPAPLPAHTPAVGQREWAACSSSKATQANSAAATAAAAPAAPAAPADTDVDHHIAAASDMLELDQHGGCTSGCTSNRSSSGSGSATAVNADTDAGVGGGVPPGQRRRLREQARGPHFPSPCASLGSPAEGSLCSVDPRTGELLLHAVTDSADEASTDSPGSSGSKHSREGGPLDERNATRAASCSASAALTATSETALIAVENKQGHNIAPGVSAVPASVSPVAEIPAMFASSSISAEIRRYQPKSRAAEGAALVAAFVAGSRAQEGVLAAAGGGRSCSQSCAEKYSDFEDDDEEESSLSEEDMEDEDGQDDEDRGEAEGEGEGEGEEESMTRQVRLEGKSVWSDEKTASVPASNSGCAGLAGISVDLRAQLLLAEQFWESHQSRLRRRLRPLLRPMQRRVRRLRQLLRVDEVCVVVQRWRAAAGERTRLTFARISTALNPFFQPGGATRSNTMSSGSKSKKNILSNNGVGTKGLAGAKGSGGKGARRRSSKGCTVDLSNSSPTKGTPVSLLLDPVVSCARNAARTTAAVAVRLRTSSLAVALFYSLLLVCAVNLSAQLGARVLLDDVHYSSTHNSSSYSSSSCSGGSSSSGSSDDWCCSTYLDRLLSSSLCHRISSWQFSLSSSRAANADPELLGRVRVRGASHTDTNARSGSTTVSDGSPHSDNTRGQYFPGQEWDLPYGLTEGSVASSSEDQEWGASAGATAGAATGSKSGGGGDRSRGTVGVGKAGVLAHWVRLGDSISFGDFSSYGSSQPPPNAGTGPASAVVHDNNNARRLERPVRSFPAAQPQAPPPQTGRGGGGAREMLHQEEEDEYEYQWTRDGNDILNDMGNVPFFAIKRARLSDAGRYVCYRRTRTRSRNATAAAAAAAAADIEDNNGKGGYSGVVEIIADTVIQISKEPKVSTRPSYQEVPVGSALLLSLQVEGIPPPTFQWFKNGYQMPGHTQRALVFENVTYAHSGTYSCDVQNLAGGFVWLEATVLVV